MSRETIARGNQARRDAIIDAWIASLPQRLSQAVLHERAMALYLHGETNFRLRQAERARAEKRRGAA